MHTDTKQMQGPSIGALALVPTQVGSQVAACRQSSSPGRATSRVRLQAFPKLVSAERTDLQGFITFYHLIEGVLGG